MDRCKGCYVEREWIGIGESGEYCAECLRMRRMRDVKVIDVRAEGQKIREEARAPKHYDLLVDILRALTGVRVEITKDSPNVLAKAVEVTADLTRTKAALAIAREAFKKLRYPHLFKFDGTITYSRFVENTATEGLAAIEKEMGT